MSQEELKTTNQKVAFLMDNFPQARNNYLYLLLSYWQVFDGIEIPKGVLQAAAEHATQPETITRARRKVLEMHRYRQFLELQRMVQGQE